MNSNAGKNGPNYSLLIHVKCLNITYLIHTVTPIISHTAYEGRLLDSLLVFVMTKAIP